MGSWSNIEFDLAQSQTSVERGWKDGEVSAKMTAHNHMEIVNPTHTQLFLLSSQKKVWLNVAE